MAGIPQNFQSVSNVLPTYSFVDIASGTGYVTFYAGATVDLKLLSNFTYYSDTFVYSGNTNSTTYVSLLDHDYDTVLNRPLVLYGKGIVNIPYAYKRGAAGTCVTYAKVTLRKYDGVTETDICTNDSREVTYTSGTLQYDILSVDLNIPLTTIKKGETLRLTIEVFAHSNNIADTAYAYYASDPKGRTTGWDTTGAVPSVLTFQCPVRLNL
jgi:hypothetical protein